MKICNIVVCLDTKRRINLIELAKRCPDKCKYRPLRFPGLSLRIPEFKTTILVFKSGKVVAIGAEMIGDASDSFRKLMDLLDFPLVLVEFAKVSNYVASGSVDHHVDIAKVYEKCKTNVFFNPEIFSGLQYRLKSCRVTVIILYSGKLYNYWIEILG